MTGWDGWLMNREAGCQCKPVIEGGCELPHEFTMFPDSSSTAQAAYKELAVAIICSYILDSFTSLLAASNRNA